MAVHESGLYRLIIKECEIKMFYELIYTRCKKGLDILRNGSPITSEGYKIYSCSPEIYTNKGVSDNELLINAAQFKQSYIDSYETEDKSKIFMDDAYLYYAPDFGNNFLVNFHPVKFIPNSEANYSNRPGNFINHILIGNFANYYAWQFFRDSNIWYAQQKDEAYYYNTDPQPLKPREIIFSGSYYNYDSIKNFISSGNRAELLKKAAAFIISQYGLNYPERKYLLIHDLSSENIELWIAAIECAFSPRMSSGLPFATRMNKYTRNNNYTVMNGVSQTVTNLQDNRQELRYKAMIIGLNAKDRDNSMPVRVLASSPFVLLDAVNGVFNYEPDINIKSEYFDLITRFDDKHKNFCMNFLQSLRASTPVKDLPELYNAFKIVNDIKNISLDKLAASLEIINFYGIINTETTQKIYLDVKKNIDVLMRRDFINSLPVMEWLKNVAAIFGDSEAGQYISERVYNFVKYVILTTDLNLRNKQEIISHIMSGGFKNDAMRVIISPETLQDFINSCNYYKPEYVLYFIGLYRKAYQISGLKVSQNNLSALIFACIKLCASSKNFECIKNLFEYLAAPDRKNLDFAINIMISASGEYGSFTVKSIISEVPEILHSFAALSEFCELLNTYGQNNFSAALLIEGVNKIKSASDLKKFPEWLTSRNYISDSEIENIFTALDSKIKSENIELAALIQKYRPENIICRKSANIIALNIINTRNKYPGKLDEIIKIYEKQGFPNLIDGDFPEKFASLCVKSASLKPDDIKYLYRLAMNINTPREILSCIVHELIINIKKFPGKWNLFLLYACKDKEIKKEIYNIILDELYEMSSVKKILKLLDSNTDRKEIEVSDFINQILDAAEEDIKRRKPSGIITRIFNKFFGKNNKSDDI